MLENLLQLAPKEVLSLIFGKMLGDGNLTIEKHRQPRFRFQHCYLDREWGFYCYDSLRSFIPLAPPKKRIISDSRLIKGYSESIYVQSRTSPLFVFLKEIWYQGNKKVIPFDILSRIIYEAGLAWWYQDEGHLKIDNNKVRKIILSTDNFSSKENDNLIELLKQKFNLSFSLDGQNRLCLYDQVQILFFLYTVKPHIHFSMDRKIYHHLDTIDQSLIPQTKRTTISLPDTVSIISATQDIINIIKQIDMDSFIHNWFTIWHQEKSSIFNNTDKIRYQIAINKECILKLEHIKNQTGLKMNDIVYLASLFH
jgi:hypothetical protein